MAIRKERLTVTVDRDLLAAANESVAGGHAESLSAWVNAALAERIARERRLAALGAALEAYEAQFGTISSQELLAQARADRANAIVVRGRRTQPRKPGRRKRT